MRADQAANYLGLARQTLAKLRWSGGSPPFYRMGSRILYDRADLDEWLDARRRASTSDTGSGIGTDGIPRQRRRPPLEDASPAFANARNQDGRAHESRVQGRTEKWAVRR